ncbi:MAG: MarR family transcriptional regulator [Ktedonobacteraceae bacterium]|nr:MarR family transcriptional regulator [Ktedonobacteraceae bacterium]
MDFQPDDNPGFLLFYAQLSVAYAFAEALKACCQEHNKPYVITPPQWGILILLYENDGLTIGTVSQKRGFDAPSITGVVKRLEQSGLVERRHDLQDRRLVKVFLTEEGRDIMQFLPAAVTAFSQSLIRGFSEAELRDLRSKLRRIMTNVSAETPGKGTPRFNFLSQHGWFAPEEHNPAREE